MLQKRSAPKERELNLVYCPHSICKVINIIAIFYSFVGPLLNKVYEHELLYLIENSIKKLFEVFVGIKILRHHKKHSFQYE